MEVMVDGTPSKSFIGYNDQMGDTREVWLLILPDGFYSSQSEQLATLAQHHAVPAAYLFRTFVAAGGLISYGGNIDDQYRLVGTYVGRILKGEKPSDLPVQQVTKIQLMINLKTARALGLTMPTALLVRADEVIE
jgi:putative ABC transport system substrate-binding protein